MAAKSGLLQLLKAFGIDFDPEEIKTEALKFQQMMLGIHSELQSIRQRQDALAKHLGMELPNDGHLRERPGDGTTQPAIPSVPTPDNGPAQASADSRAAP